MRNFRFSKSEFSINLDNVVETKGIYYENKNLLKEVKSIWFRRPDKSLKDFYEPNTTKTSLIPPDVFNNWLNSHFRVLKEFIVEHISQKKILGSYTITGLNKPHILKLAKKNGLEIPNTLITNSYIELQNFFQKNNRKIICKALHECVMLLPRDKNYGICEYANLIEDIKTIPNALLLQFFKNLLKKIMN